MSDMSGHRVRDIFGIELPIVPAPCLLAVRPHV